jgi:hypothetical protein
VALFLSQRGEVGAAPNARYLVIVASGETGIWEYLRDALARDRKTEVLIDRRRGEPGTPPPGVRDRRHRVPFDQDLRFRRVIVRREQPATSPDR